MRASLVALDFTQKPGTGLSATATLRGVAVSIKVPQKLFRLGNTDLYQRVLPTRESQIFLDHIGAYKKATPCSVSTQPLPSPLSSTNYHVHSHRHPLPRGRQAAPGVHARQACHWGKPLGVSISSITTHTFFASMTPSSSLLCSGTRLHPPRHPNSPSPPPATMPHALLPVRTSG